MNEKYIWVVRTDLKSELDQQTDDWMELASEQAFSIASIINIHGRSVVEFIETLHEEMEKQAVHSIAFESYTTLSQAIGQAMNIATAIIEAGGKIFVFSPAVHALVEIPKDKLHFLLSVDDFIVLKEEDMPFLLSYADKEIKLQTLIYHLTLLKATLELQAIEEWSMSSIIREIRHAILLAQLIQLKSN